MVAYTYQLSLFSIVVLLVIAFLFVLTLINWIKRLLLWLAGNAEKKVKPKVKEDETKPIITQNEDEVDNVVNNEFPDLDQKKGL